MSARPDSILHTLYAYGYDAYYVGGCVRDLLLGRPVHDWDICTNARPEQVMALFPSHVPIGLAHGTILVRAREGQAEVTTFRTEGDYLDGRHPSKVVFVPSLKEDLARRDFTVNAMAMDAQGNVTDCFGGQADLHEKTLRCVGDPCARFSEDALRMLRAWRFAAQLGFQLDKQTMEAIEICAPWAMRLSAERVRDELEKTICSPRPELAGNMASAGLLRSVGIEGELKLESAGTLPAERMVRWAALAQQAPVNRLRLDKHTFMVCTQAAAVCKEPLTERALAGVIAHWGWETAYCAAALDGKLDVFAALRNSGRCLRMEQLAVRGGDFPWLSGPEIGKTLHMLLTHVLDYPEDNEHDLLLRLAKNGPAG